MNKFRYIPLQKTKTYANISTKRGYRIVAIMSPCQGLEAGSIPATRSTKMVSAVFFVGAYLRFRSNLLYQKFLKKSTRSAPLPAAVIGGCGEEKALQRRVGVKGERKGIAAAASAFARPAIRRGSFTPFPPRADLRGFPQNFLRKK